MLQTLFIFMYFFVLSAIVCYIKRTQLKLLQYINHKITIIRDI